MATALPPASNEMVDGNALEWLVTNGYLDSAACGPLPDLGNEVTRVSDFKNFIAHVDMSAYALPDHALMPYSDMLAYMENTPCNTTPGAFDVYTPATPQDAICQVGLSWTNPADAEANWDVQIFECPGTGCDPINLVATVKCSGPSTSQSYLHTTTSGWHTYKIRYRYVSPHGTSAAAGPYTASDFAETACGTGPG